MINALAVSTFNNEMIGDSRVFNLDIRGCLSNHDMKIIHNCKNTLKKYEGVHGLYLMCGDNFKELLTIIEDVEANNKYLEMEYVRSINRVLVNYLSSTKMFLEHTEIKIKKTFGDKSQEFSIWKSATSKEYDDYFSYRFLYQLRNFTQHIGLPIGNFNQSIDPKKEKRSKLNIFFSKEYLLGSSFDWKKIKDELESQNEHFSVMPILQEYNKSIYRLCIISLELLIVPDVNDLVKYIEMLKQKDVKGLPYLINFKNQKERLTPQKWKGFQPLPYNDCADCIKYLIKNNLVSIDASSDES